MESSSIVFLIVLVVLSAVFSGSETAFVAISPSKVKAFVGRNRSGAKYLQKLRANPHRMLSTILVGSNVVSIGASVMATIVFTDLFGSRGVGIATGIMIFVMLVFGEVIPKTLAQQFAEPIALILAFPTYAMQRVLTPIVWLLEKLSVVIHRAFGDRAKQRLVTEDELKAMVDLGAAEGSIEKQEKEMIENIFEFNDTTASEIMTPRVDVDMLEAKTSIEDAVKFIQDHPHSRIPVYLQSVDKIIGVLTVRELLQAMKDETAWGKPIDSLDLVMPLRCPESKKINRLFKEFQKSRIHIAIVKDEHGGFEGIVTLEDVIEELVGEIADEHDVPERLIHRLDKKTIMVKGKTEIDHINRALNVKIPADDHVAISWFILEKLGRFPTLGEEITIGAVTLKIEEMGDETIEEVKITKHK